MSGSMCVRKYGIWKMWGSSDWLLAKEYVEFGVFNYRMKVVEKYKTSGPN